MTISLATGSNSAPIDFLIKNDQLVAPDLVIDTNSKVIFNSSVAELLVNPLLPPNDQDMMKLGRPFFSAAYLLVDYDASTFTIWKANQTNDVNLMPVLKEQASQSCSPNSTIPIIPPKQSPSRPRGKIIGAVVGGLIGLVILLLAVWWIVRSRKRTAKEIVSDPAFRNTLEPGLKESKEFYSELSNQSSSPRVYEAPTESQRAPYELEGSS